MLKVLALLVVCVLMATLISIDACIPNGGQVSDDTFEFRICENYSFVNFSVSQMVRWGIAALETVTSSLVGPWAIADKLIFMSRFANI